MKIRSFSIIVFPLQYLLQEVSLVGNKQRPPDQLTVCRLLEYFKSSHSWYRLARFVELLKPR
jgi:hypothetical protein